MEKNTTPQSDSRTGQALKVFQDQPKEKKDLELLKDDAEHSDGQQRVADNEKIRQKANTPASGSKH
jgi:hypothetical protein